MENKLDSTIIVQMVQKATCEVLSTMLDIDAEVGEAYHENAATGNSDGVVSFLGLAGPELAGTGSLRCNSKSACQFAARFLMSEFQSVDDEVLDAFGELTNMIIGNFKNELEHHVGPTGLSIPTVIYGRNFATRSLGQEEWTVVPFTCGDDRLEVKVCLKTRVETPAMIRHGERQEFILSH
jgi:chemotaxis protein CheX